MAFVHHTMLTAENLRSLPSKQLHTIEPHFSHVRERPQGNLGGVGGLVGVYSIRACDWTTLFCPHPGFRHC